MFVPKHWILAWWYPRGLIVHQQRYPPINNNKIWRFWYVVQYRCRIKYNIVGTVPNRKTVDKEAKSIPLTHIHDRWLSYLGTNTSISSGGIKLVLCAQIYTLNDKYAVMHVLTTHE